MRITPVFSLFLILSLTLLPAAGPADAGWSDTLKTVGTQAADDQATAAGLSYTPFQAASGIKQLLSLGADSAVSTLGTDGGFSATDLAIGLPDTLRNLPGAGSLTALLNSTAESSVPAAGGLIDTAIAGLDISDPVSLVTGGKQAITTFFKAAAGDTLKTQVKPLVAKALDASGISSYTSAIAVAQQAAGAAAFDPSDFVAERMLDAMFTVMGQKEEAIRANGGAGTTDLLQKLF
jgi:hypothetical protein